MTTTSAPPQAPPSPPAAEDNLVHDGRLFPRLTTGEWVTFALLAGVLAAANIYTTLLIGWGDTGSIVAVLASVLMLGLIGRSKPSIYTINLGQTMASAGGSIGFAVASYAAVYLVQPDFDPNPFALVALFAAMGVFGALVGSSVRRYMVRYFFPSGTACAVIQRSVLAETAPGERNRPLFMLKLWGAIACVLTVPTKITFQDGGHALWPTFQLARNWMQATTDRAKSVWGTDFSWASIGVDPLYYGIGLVVGPRIGLGMVLGSMLAAWWLPAALAGGAHEATTGDWVRWWAIAVLTLPTFATIVFAYLFRTPAVVPPGFEPGGTTFRAPARRAAFYGTVAVLGAAAIAVAGQIVFDLPWYLAIVTMAVAWPLCVVNGRVAGDTDINPVRLVAVVILSVFFMFLEHQAIALLGMAIVAGTLAAVAVDMMQDYRTGHLIDANPTHQTSVQLVGSLVGAIVAIPVLGLLLAQLGIGEGSSLPAPGATIWATMAKTMAEGFSFHADLYWAIGIVSLLGCGYAFLTVWPATARWMPSIFGIGIGMLLGMEASAAICGGGLLKVVVSAFYTRGRQGEERQQATASASNDTMLAGASVFAAAAILSIVLVLAVTLFDWFEDDSAPLSWRFWIAQH